MNELPKQTHTLPTVNVRCRGTARRKLRVGEARAGRQIRQENVTFTQRTGRRAGEGNCTRRGPQGGESCTVEAGSRAQAHTQHTTTHNTHTTHTPACERALHSA